MFRAPQLPTTLPELVKRLGAVFIDLAQEFERPVDFLPMKVQHTEPAKVTGGALVQADGSDWNPGSGAGLYRRSEDNTSWVHIG